MVNIVGLQEINTAHILFTRPGRRQVKAARPAGRSRRRRRASLSSATGASLASPAISNAVASAAPCKTRNDQIQIGAKFCSYFFVQRAIEGGSLD
jgi:hypothetical protein